MKGIVVRLMAGEGIVRTTEGTCYRLSPVVWRRGGEPDVGDTVRFTVIGGAVAELRVPLVAARRGQLRRLLVQVETRLPTMIYGCYATAFLYGITMVMGVIAAYSYRDSGSEPWLESHYTYQIRLFWKTLPLFLAAVPLTFYYRTGTAIVLLTYLWVILKSLKGWRCLVERRPVS
ncbi:hypothetical protein GMLC_43340 [Geomonas limicola]|uniref:Uncharacterized protein n=1 Tax=Geomonas limicola TaxID=2740186 RepID=A0A6V8NDP6_9BACT|nr:hypothetical protein [Geomonas limicola]GFO70755.1 hypothetical protein GMLC_43340 [Geomonas limicola]